MPRSNLNQSLPNSINEIEQFEVSVPQSADQSSAPGSLQEFSQIKFQTFMKAQQNHIENLGNLAKEISTKDGEAITLRQLKNLNKNNLSDREMEYKQKRLKLHSLEMGEKKKGQQDYMVQPYQGHSNHSNSMMSKQNFQILTSFENKTPTRQSHPCTAPAGKQRNMQPKMPLFANASPIGGEPTKISELLKNQSFGNYIQSPVTTLPFSQKPTSVFLSERSSRAQNIGRHVEKLRIINGKRQIKSFIASQMQTGYQKYYYQNDPNLVTTEDHQQRLFDQLDIPLDLSSEYQSNIKTKEVQIGKLIDSMKLSEFQNLEKQGMSVYYQDTFANLFKIPSTTKAYGTKALLSHLEINQIELEKRGSVNRSPVFKEFESKQKLMGLPKVRNHDHGDQIFKKEMKNSQLKNAAKYSEENIQIRQISIRNKTVEKSRNSLQADLPSLLNASQPARIYSQRNSSVFPASEFVEPKTGILQFPVSNKMIDLDDLIFNQQFQKKSFGTEELTKKYEQILHKRRQLSKQPKPGSVFDIVVSQNSVIKPPEYIFKQNGHLDASQKKKNLLKNLVIKKRDYQPQKIEIASQNEELAQKSRQNKVEKQEEETGSNEGRSGWNSANDEQFKIDKYIINVNLGLKQSFENLIEQKEFIQQIDAIIEAKKKDPQYGGALSGITIHYAAVDLYKLITGRDHHDEGYKKYLLEVFKFFPEDPLQNSNVKCNIKNLVRGQDKQKYQICNHQHEDDIELQKRYKAQMWFLNFYKYITLLILNRDILEFDVEESKAETREKIEKIGASLTLKQGLKKSKKKLAIRQILKNLEDFVKDFPETSVLDDALQVQKLMNDPIIKLVVLERPKEVMDYQIQEPIIGVDKNKQFYINDLANRVLKNYQNELISIKKRKYVTFKNISEPDCFCLFDEEQTKIVESKMSISRPLTPVITGSRISSMQNSPLRTEMSEVRVQEESGLSILERPNIVEGTQLTKHDMIKQVMNLMIEAGHQDTVKQYDILNKLQNKISLEFQNYKKKMYTKKELLNKNKGEVKIDYKELTGEMPIMLKISLYQNFKKIPQKVSVKIHDKQDQQFQFFNKAKQLVQGIEDNENCQGQEIEYFKMNRSAEILPMPLFFKYVQNNELCLHRVNVIEGQAISIRNTLIQAQKCGEKSLSKNPFLIKTLIINDCGMPDNIFEIILQGIEQQKHIKNIHYIGNELGPKSTEILARIVSREKADLQLQELNLSNLKLVSSDKTLPQNLVSILQEAEYKLLRLKLSNMDLSQPKTMENLCNLLFSNYNIMTYLNLSYSNIQLKDLVIISKELSSFSKLDYLSLGGNKITQNCLAPRRPVFATTRKIEPEQVYQELLQDLANHICDVVLEPQSQLRYLDISELGFEIKHLRQICEAVDRNHTLESINFGSFFGDKEQKDVVMEVLGVNSSKKITMLEDFSMVEEQIKYKELYQKTAIWKKVKEEKNLRNSLLLDQNDSNFINPQTQLILNRTARNPELVFNSYQQEFDPFSNRKWFPVKECFLCNRHRYTQIFYNINNPNCEFEEIEDQEILMKSLDRKYKGSTPLIIVNGKVHQMINPSVYACLLSINKIQAEIKLRLGTSHGAFEITGIKNDNRKLQESHTKVLKEISESEMQELLCDIAQESISLYDLDKMTDHQLKIIKNFHLMSWERIIDEEAINENLKYTTIFNQQKFDYNERFVQTIDAILQKRKPTQAPSSIPGGIVIEENKPSSSALPTPEVLDVVLPQMLSIKSQKEYQFVLQVNFLFAGYLPPGKNTVYIYDRHNRILLGRELFIDFSNGYAGEHNPPETIEVNRTIVGPTFTFKPADPSPERIQEDEVIEQ